MGTKSFDVKLNKLQGQLPSLRVVNSIDEIEDVTLRKLLMENSVSTLIDTECEQSARVAKDLIWLLKEYQGDQVFIEISRDAQALERVSRVISRPVDYVTMSVIA